MSAALKEEVVEDDTESQSTDVSEAEDEADVDSRKETTSNHDETSDKEGADRENSVDYSSDSSESDNAAVNEVVLPNDYSHPLSASHRLGLEVVAGDDDDSSFDLIAIHGLQGWSRAAWEKKPQDDTFKSWLDTEYPALKFYSGRIMLYGYDPGDRNGMAWTSYGIYKEAEAMLDALMELRTSEIRDQKRPIWFISQDTGGAIVKAALVLASKPQSRYREILRCTRSLVFFSYPHKYTTRGFLEEYLSLFLSALQLRPFKLNLIQASKNLAQMIIEINDAFIHTRLLAQLNIVNVTPTLEQVSLHCLPPFMTCLFMPFEHWLRIPRPVISLVVQMPDTVHELISVPNRRWLSPADLPDELHSSWHQLIDQIPPVYTYHDVEPNCAESFPQLEDFLKPSDTRIIHLRCHLSDPVTTLRVAHRAILYILDKWPTHPFFSFKFNAHDIRFSSATAMLQAFMFQFLSHRGDEEWQGDVPTRITMRHHLATYTREDLFEAFDLLRRETDFNNSLFLLGGFDECDESSLWFISRLREYVERTETAMKIIITTTLGTPKDEAIVSELSHFPSDIVQSVEYDPGHRRMWEHIIGASLLVQERPFLARDGRHKAVEDLLYKKRFDMSLCGVLAEWLKTAPNPFKSGAKLFKEDVPAKTTIFEAVLSEMPTSRRSWAQKLLSWMVASLRPLQVKEFFWISHIIWHHTSGESQSLDPDDAYDAWTSVADTIKHFCGLLTIENGEVLFRDLETRRWLLGDNDAQSAPWYSQGSEEERHGVILQTCLKYLCDGSDENAGFWAEKIPYAIEFWPRHYEHAPKLRSKANLFFEHQAMFQRWLEAYRELPTPLLKPRQQTSTPIAVAAHFEMWDAVQSALTNSPDDAEAKGLALVEAARVGNLDILNLILESYSPAFDFDDLVLHHIVKAGSCCGNAEVFRRVVSIIPARPQSLTQPEDTKSTDSSDDAEESDDEEETAGEGAVVGDASSVDEEKATDGEKTANEEKTTNDKSENQEAIGEDKTIDEENAVVEKKAVDRVDTVYELAMERERKVDEGTHIYYPLLWLARPLSEASSRGHDDVVSKLLSLGAQVSLLSHENPLLDTPLHRATSFSHVNCMKLLIDAGADVNEMDSEGLRPLCLAVSADAVTTLLDNGAALDLDNYVDEKPIQTMIRLGNFVALEAALSYKKHQEYFTEGPADHPVNLSARFGKRRCLESVMRHGFSPNHFGELMQPALWYAIDTGRMDVLRVLLDNGADPDLAPDGTSPPLHKSVFVNSLDMMKVLVDHKANIERRESPGAWNRTPLSTAIDWHRVDMAKYLLGKGADPNVKDSDDIWPLFSAAENGLNDVVKMLVEAKADLKSVSGLDKWTPIHAAYKLPETVALLIELGADLSTTTLSDSTPLDLALAQGHRATMDIILEKTKTKYDFSAKGAQKALVRAVENGHHEAVAAALEAGADVNTVDPSWGNEPLISTAMRLDDEDTLRTLLEFRADVNLVSDDQSTALHCITAETPVASIKLFVNAGGRLDALNKDRLTPLAIAAYTDNNEVFRYLLSKEAARSVLHVVPREQAFTAMHTACMSGTLSMVELLVQHDFDVNFACEGAWGTPLMAAVVGISDKDKTEDKKKVIELLLEKGADPNKSAGWYGTPLLVACRSNTVDIVRMVLDQKVAIDVKDPWGRKAAHVACYNSLEVLRVLDLPDSDFTVRDAVGRVPLHYAVLSGQPDLVEEVLTRSARVGIDVNVKDADGWTPLLWAARAVPSWRRAHNADLKSTAVVSLLLEKGADPAIEGLGFSAPCQAFQIAYYHEADAIGDFIIAKLGKEPPESKTRGKHLDSDLCDCCLLTITGTYSKCSDCFKLLLCFKCSRSRSKTHPRHVFTDEGEEFHDEAKKETEEVKEETKPALNADGIVDTETAAKDEEEVVDDEFDDEIVG